MRQDLLSQAKRKKVPMFPEKSKFGQWVAGLVIVVYAVSNPTSAAQIVNTVVKAISQFANALG